MQINQIKRPWEKKSSYGNRINRDPYYQSSAWKKKVDFIWQRDNSTCQLCLSHGKLHPLTRGTNDITRQGTVDHKIQRINGGSDEYDNLWLIGTNHHNRKSAKEGNEIRRKK